MMGALAMGVAACQTLEPAEFGVSDQRLESACDRFASDNGETVLVMRDTSSRTRAFAGGGHSLKGLVKDPVVIGTGVYGSQGGAAVGVDVGNSDVEMRPCPQSTYQSN